MDIKEIAALKDLSREELESKVVQLSFKVQHLTGEVAERDAWISELQAELREESRKTGQLVNTVAANSFLAEELKSQVQTQRKFVEVMDRATKVLVDADPDTADGVAKVLQTARVLPARLGNPFGTLTPAENLSVKEEAKRILEAHEAEKHD